MSASYRNVRVSPGEVRFEIHNGSSRPWRAQEGFRVGYHLFDAENGTLIEDGPRVALARDLEPGDWAQAVVPFSLPPEPGRYRVVVSPMREGVCWYYEKGWPFVLLEEGRASVSTRRRLRLSDGMRSLGRAFTYPVLTIWKNRSLIRSMVRRDVLGRYRGSFGGAFWTVLNPLLLMLTYFFVFGVVLQARFGADPSRTGFALYFLAGMLPWLAFSEAAGRAPTVMLEHRNFVKKLVFALETLPVNLVVSGLVTEVFAVLLFVIGLLVLRGGVPASLLWLPALVVPQALFTLGMCWFLAGLGVFVRDLGQVIGFLLTLWFFLTPICYPEASLPGWAAAALPVNPIYVLVRGYRAILLEGHAPAFGALWKLWLLAAAVFVAGHAWFYKLRKSFPDVI
jgi:lipopolysaccharide transport system permease protein